jgi:hypothetical protein
MAAIGARALRGIDEKRSVGFLFFHNVFDRPTHVQSAGIQPTVAGWRRFGLLLRYDGPMR